MVLASGFWDWAVQGDNLLCSIMVVAAAAVLIAMAINKTEW